MMSDPTKMLMKSLINYGNQLAISIRDAQNQPSSEKREEVHAKVRDLIPQILKELKHVQLPPFPHKILSKIFDKVGDALQKFTELDSDHASDYEELRKSVNNCKSQMETTLAVRSSSSFGVLQPVDSTRFEASGSDGPEPEQFTNLSAQEKKCMFCFCLFPPGKTVKRREPIHLWIGMGLIADSLEGAKMLEKLVGGGFIECITGNTMMFNGYAIKQEVYTMVEKEMKIEFLQDSIALSIMYQNQQQQPQQVQPEASEQHQNQLQEQQTASQTQQQDHPTTLRQQEEQSPPSQKTASKNILVKRRSPFFKQGSNAINQRNQDDRNVLGNLVMLKKNGITLQSTMFEQISKLKNDVKVVNLGSWFQNTNQTSYIVLEVEALKALTKHTGQVGFLSLQGILGIVELPDSVYRLKELKVLDLRGCPNLESLSSGIQSLKQLTHLDLSECYLLDYIPEEIASLTQLRVLKGFIINNPQVSKTGKKHKNQRNISSSASFIKLKALKNLIKLTIRTRRGNFPNSDDFNTMCAMDKLAVLRIAWVCSYDEVSSDDVSGRFPVSLGKLELQATPETTMLRLLKQVSDFAESSLKKVYIRGGRFRELRMEEMHCLAHVHTIRLRYLPELHIDWGEFREFCPNLMRLEVFKCPNLTFFPCDENGVCQFGNEI